MRKAYGALLDLRERRLAFETVLDDYGKSLPDAKGLSSSVRRRLGQQALWAAGRAYDRGGTERRDVNELMEFALDCWPAVSGLSLYRTLQSGNGIGPRGMSYMLAQKTRWWLRRRSWKYRGI
jgi:hypothetical protein